LGLGAGKRAGPDGGRPLHRRGADHWHLLSSVLRGPSSQRENVRFFATTAEARATGLRACLRCKPDDVSREAEAMERAVALLAGAEEAPSLDALAQAVGYSPFHFHRLFNGRSASPRQPMPAACDRSGLRRRSQARPVSPTRSMTPAIPAPPASMPTHRSGWA
jgi:AraC family transcriptional regulator of adaptative response/methylated-DNA-[protein]-cysteine methyltransferase